MLPERESAQFEAHSLLHRRKIGQLVRGTAVATSIVFPMRKMPNDSTTVLGPRSNATGSHYAHACLVSFLSSLHSPRIFPFITCRLSRATIPRYFGIAEFP